MTAVDVINTHDLFEPNPAAMPVIDPLLKDFGRLWIQMECVEPTKASRRWASGVQVQPSLCILHQKGQCNGGPKCNQVHVDPMHMSRIRDLLQQRPFNNCCKSHGDLASQRSDFYGTLCQRTIHLKAGVHLTVITPDVLAMSTYFECYIADPSKLPSNGRPLLVDCSRICKLHQRQECKYGPDCRNVHICREFWAHLPPEAREVSTIPLVVPRHYSGVPIEAPVHISGPLSISVGAPVRRSPPPRSPGQGGPPSSPSTPPFTPFGSPAPGLLPPPLLPHGRPEARHPAAPRRSLVRLDDAALRSNVPPHVGQVFPGSPMQQSHPPTAARAPNPSPPILPARSEGSDVLCPPSTSSPTHVAHVAWPQSSPKTPPSPQLRNLPMYPGALWPKPPAAAKGVIGDKSAEGLVRLGDLLQSVAIRDALPGHMPIAASPSRQSAPTQSGKDDAEGRGPALKAVAQVQSQLVGGNDLDQQTFFQTLNFDLLDAAAIGIDLPWISTVLDEAPEPCMVDCA